MDERTTQRDTDIPMHRLEKPADSTHSSKCGLSPREQLERQVKLHSFTQDEGTDEYVKMIKEKAKDNPDIIFTGFISGNVLAEIYSNAYLVTLPSDIEGMSLSLLEALAYGNAVLCSDIPENTLVTEDKAMHFKKSNVDDLAEKLQIMCDNENIVKELKNEAAQFILGKYNWQDVAARTCDLYKKALRK